MEPYPLCSLYNLLEPVYFFYYILVYFINPYTTEELITNVHNI
jgi:hypothetical protein